MTGIIYKISEQIHYKLNEVEIIIFKDPLWLLTHSQAAFSSQPEQLCSSTMRHLMENGFKWWFDELVFSISLLLTVGWVSLLPAAAGWLLLLPPPVP